MLWSQHQAQLLLCLFSPTLWQRQSLSYLLSLLTIFIYTNTFYNIGCWSQSRSDWMILHVLTCGKGFHCFSAFYIGESMKNALTSPCYSYLVCMFAVPHIWVTKKPLKVVWLSDAQTCEFAPMRTYTLSPCCSCRNTALPPLSATSLCVTWSFVITITSLFLWRNRRCVWLPSAW